jgi:hypothetical protein
MSSPPAQPGDRILVPVITASPNRIFRPPSRTMPLPAADHRVTFRWITDGQDIDSHAVLSYFRARLTEAAGDIENAASQYRKLLTHDTRFQSQAEAGLARCAARLAGDKRAQPASTVTR